MLSRRWWVWTERKASWKRPRRALDLPSDVVAGSRGSSCWGTGNSGWNTTKGILAYGTDEIHISGGKLVVRVKGEGLELRSMNPTELLITGRIASVDFS